MPWVEVNQGHFEQQECKNAIITTIQCKANIKFELHIHFSNLAGLQSFEKTLDAKMREKTTSEYSSNSIRIVFFKDPKCLRSIFQALNKVEPLPGEVTQALCNFFQFNEHQQLIELSTLLEQRLALIQSCLAEMETKQMADQDKQECAGQVFGILSKESLPKLSAENNQFRRFLSSIKRSETSEKESKPDNASKVMERL